MDERRLARSRLPLGSFFAQQPSQSQMKIHTHTLSRLEFERAHFFQVPLFISDNMSDNQLQMFLNALFLLEDGEPCQVEGTHGKCRHVSQQSGMAYLAGGHAQLQDCSDFRLFQTLNVTFDGSILVFFFSTALLVSHLTAREQ